MEAALLQENDSLARSTTMADYYLEMGKLSLGNLYDQGNVLKSLLRKIIIKYKSNPLWVKPLSFVFGADRRPFGAGGLFAFGSL